MSTMNYMFDIKYAWRLLLRSWGHSLLCIGVVALSVGLALWSYSVVYSQALKPLGFPGSENWYSIQIAADAKTVARPTVDAYTYQEIRRRNPDIRYIGVCSSIPVLLSEGQASVSLRGSEITPQLMEATKVKPLYGRIFNEEDAVSGAVPVAILSYDAWKNYFASDAKVIGRATRIDSKPVQIVGIMPKDFFFYRDYEVWLPLRTMPQESPDSKGVPLSPIVLLEKKDSVETASAAMQSAVEDVNRRYTDLFNSERHVQLIPASRMLTHSQVTPTLIIAFLSLAILLLGCVNIGMVFLARFIERSRELALRSALGASRGRLITQCLIETSLIVVLGLIVGFFLAMFGVLWTQSLGDFLARVGGTGKIVNLPTLGVMELVVAVLAAVLIWLLSTLLPASRIAKQDTAVALGGTGKGAAVRGSSKMTSFLVGIQILISSLVLVICGNLVVAINEEANKPNGLNTYNVMISTSPTNIIGRYATADERLKYWEDLEMAIKNRIPNTMTAFITSTPTRPANAAVAIETREGGAGEGELMLPVMTVSKDYFEVLGIRLRSGRFFDDSDDAGSLGVAVVDEKTSARFWPGQDPIGKRIQLEPSENGPWLTVVGVASAVASQPYTPENGVIYRPLRQFPPESFQLLARMPNSSSDNRVTLLAAANDADRDLALHNLQVFDDYLTAISLQFKSIIPVFITITIIAAVMAASGLYGLISRSVAQRTQEVGIRRALGANSRQATAMFIRQGWIYLGIATVGAGLGVVVASLISKVFTNILDHILPVTVGVFVLMTLVILIASYLPTRRALAMEPGDALRHE
ncbi:MAG: FtsX-like permease family protein [Lysobacteraceae bacterium]|nr:MAG: FtsX-like permease family protein [Xanthomonadaceae bacterium]